MSTYLCHSNGILKRPLQKAEGDLIIKPLGKVVGRVVITAKINCAFLHDPPSYKFGDIVMSIRRLIEPENRLSFKTH